MALGTGKFDSNATPDNLRRLQISTTRFVTNRYLGNGQIIKKSEPSQQLKSISLRGSSIAEYRRNPHVSHRSTSRIPESAAATPPQPVIWNSLTDKSSIAPFDLALAGDVVKPVSCASSKICTTRSCMRHSDIQVKITSGAGLQGTRTFNGEILLLRR